MRHTGEIEWPSIASQSCCTGSARCVWRSSWGREERRERERERLGGRRYEERIEKLNRGEIETADEKPIG
jgi:hypothetical protein